jgi:hypothetical protein
MRQRRPEGRARGSRWSEAEAQVVLDEWRRSGESLAGFARQRGVGDQRLRYWIGQLAPSRGRDRRSASVRFHPVQLVEGLGAGRPDSRIEVVLGAGRAVRVPPGFASEDLARVLEVLDGAERGRGC